MTLIEGVGDEVTDFFIAVVVLLVSWLAWCSTNTADQRTARSGATSQQITRVRVLAVRMHQPPNLETSEEESLEQASRNNEAASNCTVSSAIDTSGENSPERNATSETTATEEVLIQAMDSFNNDDATLSETQNKVDSTVSTDTPPPTRTENSECSTENVPTHDANDISIKLKFINDDQKVVTGSLKEPLGDFKKRHFQLELEAQKLVRLVFNGKILQPDTQTLETCGLYDRCVVHCLVHQPRPNPLAQQSNTIDNSNLIYFNPPAFSEIPTATGVSMVHNEWDLGRLFVSILTLILGLAWYSRYHYAQLFTATTTLALYALTAIFSVSLFSNFFLAQDNIRNVE